jgi:signal transduction histidine kinase
LKIDSKGLQFKSLLYLTTFSVIILAVLWALQFLFLGSFYESMKLNEIKSVGDLIVNQVDDGDLAAVLSEAAFKNNLRIVLIEQASWQAWGFDGFPTETTGFPPPGPVNRLPMDYLITAIQKLQASDSDRVYYLDSAGLPDMSQAIYIAEIFDKDNGAYYLYISSAIPSIDSTISVLRTQFYIITAILLVLALVMAQWIARRLSKPITKLTKSAQRLVKGELDARFYDDGFTEIQQLASALNYATGELRSLERYRQELIANLSHDLKTPLTIIRFYSELIRDVSGDDPTKRTEHCDTIIKETDWLTGMVGEILELSKIEANNGTITKTEVDLGRCLTDVLTSFSVLASQADYSFETKIADGLWAQANEPMLRRVFYNLISNAVNFTGEDKRVIISGKAVEDTVRFEVSDTGAGIPEDQQAAIWDRYYKSTETHKRAVIGTGIGLSIVKSVLGLHDAAYGVISEPGCGSTFWFELTDTSAR